MKRVQNRRDFLKLAAVSAASGILTSGCVSSSMTDRQRKKPNIVIVFLDDSGWSDFQPFGRQKYKTPNVKRLADEGCRFDNFYVPQAICSASRAALLSGCYPGRTKVFGAHGPNGAGLNPKYKIMPEVFKSNGYKTAIFGKWHIGDRDGRRPWNRGFDESAGLLYSNDMWDQHPEDPKHWGKFPLQYFDNGKVEIPRVTKKDQATLTTRYTEKAVDFIKRNKGNPFFLYVPHSMPHVPLFVSKKFAGKSGAGLYGDVMMEIDWSVGQITKALKDSGVEKDTIVIFTSDNGPWISYGNHSGKTPFREAKGTSFDGGVRSACIIKYPDKIIAGSTSERMFCTVDLLPTLAALTATALPENTIDGRDVWKLMSGRSGAKNPHKYYPFSNGKQFQGVISGDGRWKLHIPHGYRTLVKAANDGKAGKYKQEKISLSLFDMKKDPFETTDVKDKYPDVLTRLKGYADNHKKRFYTKKKV
ncbi:MAG: sulfatase [Planctomycetes bacterium]|nr:sulfatase [Planctomycetota bacterium]